MNGENVNLDGKEKQIEDLNCFAKRQVIRQKKREETKLSYLIIENTI